MIEPTLTWQQIPGYAEQIPKVYAEMVQNAASGAIFVEIGTWLGQSAAAMGQLIRDSGKNIKFYTIDHGLGSPHEEVQQQEVARLGGCTAGEAINNLYRAGVKDHVHVITARGADVAHLFPRNSIDFVFVDAGHTWGEINHDLMIWWPRVKWNGIIAGHDYAGLFPDVRRAINVFFQQIGADWPNVDNCWKIQKPAQPKYTHSYSRTPVGIGIVTYNRRQLLADCVARVQQLVRRPYRLVVADDGSTDDTVHWCTQNNVKVITGAHRGIAYNKNRALYALYEAGCDPVITLEDDTQPSAPDWLDTWVLATRYWDHINFARHNDQFGIYNGAGTPEDPWMCMAVSAQCAATRRHVLTDVGYFDPRFKGYGHEHTEWTWRIGRAGYWGAKQRLAMTYGLTEADTPSYYNAEEIAKNAELMATIAGEPIRREPWTTEKEKAIFLAEQVRVRL